MTCYKLSKPFSSFLVLHMALCALHAAPTVLPTQTSTTPSTLESSPLNNSSTDDSTLMDASSTSPSSPYNCSLHAGAQLNHAIASFYQGFTLIAENLHSNYLQQLKVSPTPSRCPMQSLSYLNRVNYRNINKRLNSPQSVANTIGIVQGYMDLIGMSQSQSHSDTMQALYDLLNGISKDLYDVLSPTYCSSCNDTSSTQDNGCFSIPELQTLYYWSDCNLVSYISLRITQELFNARLSSRQWLASQQDGSLPMVTASDWLSSHVPSNSPAITKILQDRN